MKFDDFNYEVYNPYILVSEDKPNPVKEGEEEQAEGKSKTENDLSSVQKNDQGMISGNGNPVLSIQALEGKNLGKYDF